MEHRLYCCCKYCQEYIFIANSLHKRIFHNFSVLFAMKPVMHDFKKLQSEIAAGSETAFSELYTLMGTRLLKFAASLLHSREIAEEVIEDVFIKLWANRVKITAIDNLPVYLYVSVKNLSLNKMSERARQLLTRPFDGIEPELEALTDDPYSLLITAEMLSRMNHAINMLPPRCKMIFKLVREDGLRYKEVAEILNISVNTIDAQMAIAVQRIASALGIPKNVPQRFPAHPLKKS